ncbi:MAG: nucleotidyltransferase substrate binding protein [Mariprofundaceae bacterium]|nr:nucleotidyltransferase substrate binding protein [Mariprofundaceae bacterium]
MSQSLDLTPLQKALDSLAFAVDRTEREKPDDMLRDSVIQRFEYTYELCWKMLKRRLQLDIPSPEAIDAMSFREMIREGAERGLIDDPRAWFNYREKRNLTSHTYDAEIAKDVYQAALAFLNDAKLLLAMLQQRNSR